MTAKTENELAGRAGHLELLNTGPKRGSEKTKVKGDGLKKK
jgi:hypothetical protein